MAINFKLTITPRVNVLSQATLSDGAQVTDYIDAIVCELRATDEATGTDAWVDSWVNLAKPSEKTAADYVPFSDMSQIPEGVKAKIDAWANDEHLREALTEDVNRRIGAPREESAAWENQVSDI
tara:strand:- start:8562 stop:8933 length:372 start_codon:yes stop_codon:yes gene_type:complete